MWYSSLMEATTPSTKIRNAIAVALLIASFAAGNGAQAVAFPVASSPATTQEIS
jgi:hypothetical protein